jgi:hypothetical protein
MENIAEIRGAPLRFFWKTLKLILNDFVSFKRKENTLKGYFGS